MVSFLDQVPEEMKVYVPLFTNVITKYDFNKFLHFFFAFIAHMSETQGELIVYCFVRCPSTIT